MKAVKWKSIQPAALKTKQHIRENKRQMKSPGFMAEVLRRIGKQRSLPIQSSYGGGGPLRVSHKSLKNQNKYC